MAGFFMAAFRMSTLRTAHTHIPVGAAEGCDLLIWSLIVKNNKQDQKIAAFGSSYKGGRL